MSKLTFAYGSYLICQNLPQLYAAETLQLTSLRDDGFFGVLYLARLATGSFNGLDNPQ